MSFEDIINTSVLTKTYVTLGLVALAVFEFVTAMHIYGRRGEKPYSKLVLMLHRIGGYIFAVYLLWPIIVGLDLLERLSRYSDGWNFDGPRFYHAMLGATLFILLLLKIVFVRFYQNYRQYAQMLGMIISIGIIVTWIISGGFWLAAMGSPTVP